MHRTLFIQEILSIVFGYCFSSEKCRQGADVAALARTCQAFKEPALDVLWESLPDLSPLAQCLPEACCKPNEDTPGVYSFSRLPSELEWNTPRGYTRRIRHLHGLRHVDDDAMMVLFTLAPFANGLFPKLRTLNCQHRTLAIYAIVPSLTSLHLSFHLSHTNSAEWKPFIDAVGERCPNMMDFTVISRDEHLDPVVISRQLCRWPNLQSADCQEPPLIMDTILRLPSVPTLRKLSFSLSADLGSDLSHLGSVVVFPALTNLEIGSATLKPITNFLSRIQLPAIKDLDVYVPGYESKQDIRKYWTALQKACPSDTLTHLSLVTYYDELFPGDEPDGPEFLTLDDLRPYKDFGNLRKIVINVAWPVKLTDADLLDLVSTSPHLEGLFINDQWGWSMGSDVNGITLSGLVRLLQLCPSLRDIALMVDEQTLVEIPHGADMSFPPRKGLCLRCLDSFSTHWFDPEPVFDALGLRSWTAF